MISYKELMILHYLNSAGASYSYHDILIIFGLQVEQLDLVLDKLLNEELLVIDGYYKISEKGKRELNQHKLENVEFDDIDIDNIFTEKTMKLNEIYIPKRFSKMFK